MGPKSFGTFEKHGQVMSRYCKKIIIIFCDALPFLLLAATSWRFFPSCFSATRILVYRNLFPLATAESYFPGDPASANKHWKHTTKQSKGDRQDSAQFYSVPSGPFKICKMSDQNGKIWKDICPVNEQKLKPALQIEVKRFERQVIAHSSRALQRLCPFVFRSVVHDFDWPKME